MPILVALLALLVLLDVLLRELATDASLPLPDDSALFLAAGATGAAGTTGAAGCTAMYCCAAGDSCLPSVTLLPEPIVFASRRITMKSVSHADARIDAE